MSTLILFLPPTPAGPATEYPYTLTADGHSALSHASAAAALLPEPSRPGGEVVAIVPARQLSWQRLQLPQGVPLHPPQHTPRLRAVLEGLLEERLLDDTTELHFALQPAARADAPVWIAVCDRTWLREHLQHLELAGRRVARVVPEFAPGPTASGRTELTALGPPEDAVLVLSGHGLDQSIAVLPLSPVALTLAQLPLSDAAPDDAPLPPLRAEPSVVALAEKTLGQRVVLQSASERALEAARGDWDLAQFDLASTGRTRALRKAGTTLSALLYAPQWRAARWGVLVLLVAHVIGLNAWAWKDRATLAAKKDRVRTTLTQTFPHVQVVIDAPVQMERELTQLRQAAGSVSTRDLEPLLAALGAALPAGRQPTSIDYSAGELRLRGLPLSAEEKTAFSTRLQTAGVQAQFPDSSVVLRPQGTP